MAEIHERRDECDKLTRELDMQRQHFKQELEYLCQSKERKGSGISYSGHFMFSLQVVLLILATAAQILKQLLRTPTSDHGQDHHYHRLPDRVLVAAAARHHAGALYQAVGGDQ